MLAIQVSFLFVLQYDVQYGISQWGHGSPDGPESPITHKRG